MKTKTLKSILFYLLSTIFYLPNANAQIVYTDVNPDVTHTCSTISCNITYALDINSDGTNDFNVSVSHDASNLGFGSKSSRVIITFLNNNQAADDTASYPLAMNISDIITPSVNWGNTNSILRYAFTSKTCGLCFPYFVYAGNWTQPDKYLGIKFNVAGQIFYGWVRFSVSVSTSSGSFTIKDFAYNSIPNQSILAGETSCTVPTVNLTQNGSLSFCAGDSVIFTANGTGYQYQWKKNNVNIAGATNKTYAAKTAGVYKCKVTNSCGSKTSGTRTVTVPCRNSNENIAEALEHLSVYPNPATNSVNIKFPSDEAGEIQIVNLFGQIAFSEKINAEQIQIDVSRFSAGMYVVRWNCGENFETKTFSVIK